MPYQLGSIEGERALRLAALAQHGEGCRQRFLAALDEAYGDREETYQLVLAAYQFACELDYEHKGLTAEAYLAHPLRVTEMVLSFLQPAATDTVIIALLHNVLEVGNCTEQRLAQQFGTVVSNSIATLTVDRSREWDPDYKLDYYRRILASYAGAAAVKVIDKFDNIYMLCLNPDDSVRAKYINEIETYVLPMAKTYVPVIAGSFAAAIEDAKSTGHLEC